MCLCGLAATTMLLTSCGGNPSGDRKPSGRGGQGANATQAKAPNFALSAVPAGAKDVADIKTSAKRGDEVVMRGIVGGRPKPFLDEVAVVTVVDVNFVGPCDPDGHCSIPWDYCCSDKTAITAAMATVQVVDTDGKPLPGTLRGVGGLEPLATVTVRGTVADVERGKRLVINAAAAHVQPYKPTKVPDAPSR